MTETASLIIKVDSRGAKSASADLDRLTDASGKAEKATDGLSRAWRTAAGVLSAAAVARVTRAYLDAADTTANMTARLRLATKSQEEFTAAQEATFRIAQSAGTELEGVVNLYGRLAQSSTQLGLSQAQVAQLTETVTQAFIVSGATSQEAAGGIRQLTQALAGGTVRAEEFNSIIESSPRIVQALADHFGVSFGEVRKLVNDGRISSEQFAAAMLNASDKIGAEFRQMPLTVSRATQEVRNALLNLVGSADGAAGASAGLAESIQQLARTLESQAVRDGFQTFISGVVTATQKMGEMLAASANLTKFVAEEMAARIGGASFDDIVRMEEEADRIRQLLEFMRRNKELGAAVDWMREVAGLPTRQELETRLNTLREAIADFYNTPRPKVTAPDVPAPSASLIPASLGGSDKKTKLTEEQRELNRLQDSYERYLEQLRQANALAWDTSELAEANYRIQRDGLDKINPKLAEQIRLEAQRRDELEKSKELWDQIERDYEVLTGVWEDIRRDHAKATDSMSEYAKQAARNMQSHFADFLFDPFKDGVSGMVRGFADALRRMAAEAAAAKIFEGIGAWGQRNTGSGGLVGALAGFAGKFAGGGRAAGGPVMAGQAYLVGEGGKPELFVPGQSGRVMPVQGAAAGGGNVQVQVNNYTGGQVRTREERTRGPDGTELRRLIVDVLADDLASGGKSAAVLRNRFGLREATS